MAPRIASLAPGVRKGAAGIATPEPLSLSLKETRAGATNHRPGTQKGGGLRVPTAGPFPFYRLRRPPSSGPADRTDDLLLAGGAEDVRQYQDQGVRRARQGDRPFVKLAAKLEGPGPGAGGVVEAVDGLSARVRRADPLGRRRHAGGRAAYVGEGRAPGCDRDGQVAGESGLCEGGQHRG